jgi:hypothetical protein
MMQDDFSIKELLIEVTAPFAETERTISKRRARRRNQFVMVPLPWVDKLAGARCTATAKLALHLLYRAFKERRQTVKVANGLLASMGITRRQKWRALLELETMGLIKVTHYARKSPSITLLYPAEEN